MSVIEKLSDAARKVVRDAHADPQGTVLGCGWAFQEACVAGYLLPVSGTVDRCGSRREAGNTACG